MNEKIAVKVYAGGLKTKESGTPLVRLYKDAGTPLNECSLSEF